MSEIYKYPRTRHIIGSGIQRGDEDMDTIPLREFAGRYLVVEEKMDGANSAISFSPEGHLQLQSRGHYLSGGPREKQFHLLKTWAHRYTSELRERLADRYIMYGEWLYAKHTIFYTDLPHYFMEFDILDRAAGVFLSTERRRAFLESLPFVASVLVLYEGVVDSLQTLKDFIGPSHFIKQEQKRMLQEMCVERNGDYERILKETDISGLMEGLYIKVEEEGIVTERYKFVRNSFLQAVFDSESHWMERPILANHLQPGSRIFL